MPNSSKKQKEPGLEDELRKMILGNVRVQDDEPRGSPGPGKRYGNQSPRGQGVRNPRSPSVNDQQQQQHGDRNGRSSAYHGADHGTRGGRGGGSVGRNGPRFQRSGSGRDANAADRQDFVRPPPRSTQLYQPNPGSNTGPAPMPRHTPYTPRPPPPAIFIAQCEYLDRLANSEVSQSQMSYEEYSSKEEYRNTLEQGFRQTLQAHGLPGHEVLALRGFGSFSSGFATANSDVDLAVVLRPLLGQTAEQFARLAKEMPRVLEKALLDAGFGARLLDRTRVPIIKTCQAPTPELLIALREERVKWDELPEEEKYAPRARKETSEANEAETANGELEWQWKSADNNGPTEQLEQSGQASSVKVLQRDSPAKSNDTKSTTNGVSTEHAASASRANGSDGPKTPQKAKQKAWLRERPRGPLDFPKEGVGIQADINFSNALALHNTELLRCYSLCDSRVQPMVLFVKAWAKTRKINSSYNGTLSSYGFVLMVLHFLTNVAQPPVLPNLQLEHPALSQAPTNGSIPWEPLPDQGVVCDGWRVNFWREPDMIKDLAAQGLLTQNREPLGVLLRNFFHYFAHQGDMVIGRGFQWTSEVLSLRSRDGLLTKEVKGWTGAKTTTTDNREVRHRYLFAIEDPFELEHNVARTVTHHGIVAIRDEFRRAWRILMDVGNGRQPQQGDLFDPVIEVDPSAEIEDAQKPSATLAPQQQTVPVNANNDAAFLQKLAR